MPQWSMPASAAKCVRNDNDCNGIISLRPAAPPITGPLLHTNAQPFLVKGGPGLPLINSDAPLEPDMTLYIGAEAISTIAEIHTNLSAAPLVEHAVRHGEAMLAKDGPLVVETGRHTGRSANDKFIVRDAETESSIWWGKTNKSITPEHFAALKADFFTALADCTCSICLADRSQSTASVFR
jgi:hypothetical protein